MVNNNTDVGVAFFNDFKDDDFIDKEEFSVMKRFIADFDKKREDLIIAGRKLLVLSKKTIYNVHRNNLDAAKKTLDESFIIVKLLKEAVNEDYLFKIPAVSAALQEWVESYSYFVFVKENRLLKRSEAGVEVDDYLLGLADLSGELTRRAVLLSIEKNSFEVRKIAFFVNALLGEFLDFDFRNGELRKKTDQIRWNLQKIEELLVRIS